MLVFIRAPFYVLLVFIICVVCFLVVLVKLSLLAKLLARKTPLSSESSISLTVFGASVTNLNEPPRAFSYLHYNVGSLLGRCKQKQRGLRGLLCRWPSITEWEMYITAQGCRLRNDLYCIEWDVKLYYTIPAMWLAGWVSVTRRYYV